MTDEIGTETIRSDAPSAEDNLFGDAASGDPAFDIEEQDAGKEAEQDPQGSDAAGDESAPSDELKVVVSMKGDRAIIGVQRPSSDPYIESFDDDDVSGLALKVPAVIERARAHWEEAPRHPVYERPAAPARRRGRRQQDTAQHEPAGTNETEAPQQTLSLF